MPSLHAGYQYDIFISYRQKDNKFDGWVTQFVSDLKKELEATFKEDVSLYFDVNPHDGLAESHLVQESLSDKLQCLVFIPIVSQTYCDPKSFAWTHEFMAFKERASADALGLNVRLSGGNVASRILPVRIHELDSQDRALLEKELGHLRSIDFVFSSIGVNRPLLPTDRREDNHNKTLYRDQINKVANAIREIIQATTRPAADTAAAKAPQRSAQPETVPDKFKIGKGTILSFLVLLLAGLLIWRWTSNTSPSVSDNSILVLPLKTIQQDSAEQYFSEGVTADIISELSKIHHLSPLSWNTSFKFINTALSLPEIAAETKATYILSGTVRRIASQLAIYVELADPRNNKVIYTDTFQKDTKLILDVQKEIAVKVASALKLTLSPKEESDLGTYQTSNFEAYDLFLKARAASREIKLGVWPLQKSQKLLDQVIELDPQFAEAYALKAFNYIDMTYYLGMDPVETGRLATQAITKAIELKPESPDNYFVMGGINFFLNWDLREAERNFTRGWALSNNGTQTMYHCMCTFSEYNLGRGNFQETLNIVNTVMKKDPYYPFAEVERLYAYVGLNDRQAIQSQKEQYPNSVLMASYNYLLGNYDESVRYFKKEQSDFIWPNMHLASALYKAGKKHESDSVLNLMINQSKTYRNYDFRIATVYAARGEKEEAIRWYKLAFEKRDFWIVFTRVTPDIDLIKDEPDVKKVMAEIGL